MRIKGIDHRDTDTTALLEVLKGLPDQVDRDSRPETEPRALTVPEGPEAAGLRQAMERAAGYDSIEDLDCVWREADKLAASTDDDSLRAQAFALKCETARQGIAWGRVDPQRCQAAILESFDAGQDVMRAELPPTRFGLIAGTATRQSCAALNEQALGDAHPGWSTDQLEAQAELGGTAALDFFGAMQGQRNPEAQVVCQGEIGYSSSRPLTTDTVLQCLAVAVRNPQTGKTAFTHIDHLNSPEPLDPALLDPLGTPGDGQPLQAYILGAQDGRGELAQQNLLAVRDWLATKDVEVVFARLDDPNQPGSFCIDPKTAELSTDTAPLSLRDRMSAVKMGLRDGPSPLVVAFDLDHEEGPRPVTFSDEEAAQLLERPDGQHINDMARWLDQEYPQLHQRNDQYWAGAVATMHLGAREFCASPQAKAMLQAETQVDAPSPEAPKANQP